MAGRPAGRPTRMVRVYVVDADELAARARHASDLVGATVTAADVVASLVNPPPRAATEGVVSGRCECATPTFSKHVNNLCTTCRRVR